MMISIGLRWTASPKTFGEMKLYTTFEMTKYRTSTTTTLPDDCETNAATATAGRAPRNGPMNGMKAVTPATMPSASEYGTPTIQSAMPVTNPMRAQMTSSPRM